MQTGDGYCSFRTRIAVVISCAVIVLALLVLAVKSGLINPQGATKDATVTATALDRERG
jgi:hypothetical protein